MGCGEPCCRRSGSARRVTRDAAPRVTLSRMAATLRTVRIFLSSPGDVAAERAQARELLLGLARGPFVRGRVHIDVVSWDDPHAPAPRWTRGSRRSRPWTGACRRLPSATSRWCCCGAGWARRSPRRRPTARRISPAPSGSSRTRSPPNKPVLVYRRSEKVLLDPDDPEFDEKLTQKRRVDAFFARFEGEGGAILRASRHLRLNRATCSRASGRTSSVT